MRSGKQWRFIISVGVLMIASGNGAWADTPVSADATSVVARTQAGKVRGSTDSGIHVFKGIRYGADTAKARFSAPVIPESWKGTVDATAYGASCPQTPIGSGGGLFSSWKPEPDPPMDEDCLFLNVWTPGLTDGGKRPVMVWLHGGGFVSGNGSSRAYEGTRLARRGDVVVVTLNHRLNAFGYLSLAHYGEGYEDSQVAGILDLIQALEWVRDNIAQFGGDPDTVTIFGESGGGAKVSTLMTTPAARGLFHRAVVQSGALLRFPESVAARAAADQVVAKLGLDADTIDQIKTLPAARINEALKGTGAGSAPTIDGRILTRHPFEPDAASAGREIPLMLGSNRTESSIFLGASNPALFDLTWEGVVKALEATYPELNAESIVAGYRKLEPGAKPADIYFEATTDARWLTAHVQMAESKASQGGAPAYLYLFNWDTPVEGGRWRSPHALEIGFVFDNVANSESMSGIGKDQQHIADIMADTWIAFARSGNPANARIPDWPRYDLQRRPVMVFDSTPAVVNDARAAQRALVGGDETYVDRYQ